MKSGDGVFWKKTAAGMVYYWRVAKEKSKDFSNHEECAKAYVTKYCERNPKFKDLTSGREWSEIFHIFGIHLKR